MTSRPDIITHLSSQVWDSTIDSQFLIVPSTFCFKTISSYTKMESLRLFWGECVANPVQKVLKGEKRLNEIAPNASLSLLLCVFSFSLFFGVGLEEAPKKLSDPKKCAQSLLAHLPLCTWRNSHTPFSHHRHTTCGFPGKITLKIPSFSGLASYWLPSCDCRESCVRTAGDSSPGGRVKIEF